MNVLILHGIMGKAGENWSQWLADELNEQGYKVTMPTLPNAKHPIRSDWLEAIRNLMQELGNDTIIVAHSLGVTSALDYLETHNGTIKGLLSVSGFADDYGLELNSYFMKEKDVDFSKVNKVVPNKFVFYGDNDPYVPQESLALLANNLGVNPKIIKNGGHLNESAGFNKFPMLLKTILAI